MTTPPELPRFRMEHISDELSRVSIPGGAVIAEAHLDEDIWKIQVPDSHAGRTIAAWVDNREQAMVWLRFLGHHRLAEDARNGHEL